MDQEKTYKWIQDRLRDLHSGQLSDADRLRLTELAANDPFLRDALEGYRSHAGYDHSPQLSLLSHRIQNKGLARRYKLLPTTRGWVMQAVAVSLVLVLMTWAVIYYVGKEEKTVLVSGGSEKAPYESTTSEVLMTSPDSVYDELASGESMTDEINADPSGLRANAHARIKANTDDGKKESLKSDASVRESNDYTFSDAVLPPDQDMSAKENNASVTKPATEIGAETMDEAVKSSPKRDEGYYANQMNPAMMAQRVTGQVWDPFGQPVNGAIITVPNTNLLTTSDIYGHFEFFLPDQTSSIQITSTGYGDTTLSVSQGQEDLVIMLAERTHATDVTTANEVQMANAEVSKPAGQSTTTFRDFIQMNSRYPVQNNFTLTSKKVMVEFTVSPDGRPQTIKSTKSSADKKYIDEAIRLIHKGPDWICEEDKYPCTKQYTIYFQ